MKVWKQILRAAAFFGIYFGAQMTGYVILSVICGFIVGMKEGFKSGLATDPEIVTEKMMAMYYEYQTVGLIIAAILAIGVFLIIFGARKVNPLEQVDCKKMPVAFYPVAILSGIGTTLFLNFATDLIPIPEKLLESLNEALTQTTATGPLLFNIIGIAILAPILEEVVFRGLIFGRLNRAMPTIVAMIATSALFGVLHGHILWILWAFAFGMVLNTLRVQSGSIIPCIIVHMMMNLFGVFVNNLGILNRLPYWVFFLFVIGGGILFVASLVLAIILGKKYKAAGIVTEPVLEEEERLYSRKKKPVNEVIL